MPIVSVIVPAFNAAPYLPECLDSILAQTEDDIEVVCVDDGSTDETPAILAEYALRDGRLGWISQENRGLSESRNRGIDLSSGRYLLFCDADDMLKPAAVRSLVEKAERERLDILFFGAEALYADEELERKWARWRNHFVYSRDLSSPRSGKALFSAMEQSREYGVSACLQLVRRKHLEDCGLRFYPGLLHEDDLFTFQNLLSARRAARVNDLWYVRRIRRDSIMTSGPRPESAVGYAVCVREMVRFINDHPERAPAVDALAPVIRRTANACKRGLEGISPDASAGLEKAPPSDRLWIDVILGSRAAPPELVSFREWMEKANTSRIRELREENDLLRRKLASADKTIRTLRRSLSFRIGWILTRPLAFLSRLIGPPPPP